MSRKRTGLRNRFRSGRSVYSLKDKHASRDRYGKFTSGKQDTPDVIAGRTIAGKTLRF
jgi:hypothetical protein